MGDCAPCELAAQLSLLDVRKIGVWPPPSESETSRLKEGVLFSFCGSLDVGRLSGDPKMQYMTSRN